MITYKFLVFSDLHWFKNRPYLGETCKWIAEKIKEHQPQEVLFCGDLNHTHGYVDVEVLEEMAEGIRVIRRAHNKRILAISGNHDQASRDGKENVLSIFTKDEVDAVTVNPELFAIGSKFHLVLCPYPPTAEKERKAYFNVLADILANRDGYVIAFTHWELADIPYKPGSSRSSDHAVSNVGRVDLIVNGHYHHPAIYENRDPKVVIVGSPCYHNYSDQITSTPRGVALLTLEFSADSQNQIHCCPTVTRLENPYGPVFHTIDAESVYTIKDVDPAFAKRINLRVRVDSREDYDKYKADFISMREKVHLLRVTGSSSQVAQETMVAEGTSAIAELDSLKVLESFLDSKPGLSLPKEELFRIGKSILEEATSID